MIHRNIKESLDLVRMKVHRNQTIDTCRTQHISDQLSANRNTRLILSILTSPTEVRDYSDD